MGVLWFFCFTGCEAWFGWFMRTKWAGGLIELSSWWVYENNVEVEHDETVFMEGL